MLGKLPTQTVHKPVIKQVYTVVLYCGIARKHIIPDSLKNKIFI